VEALGVIEKTRPNVAILDMRLPDGTGMDVCKAAKSSAPGTKVIMLTAYDDPGYVAAAVSLGAAGYLSKSVSAAELARAVHNVAHGWLMFGPDAAGGLKNLVASSDPRTTPAIRYELTRREAEVLRHMALGFTNAEIAEELGIAVKTVEEHVEHVLRKLGAKNRTQALSFALKKGWLQPTSVAGY
jgi:DNA-binding NarL/FixJ family response regulator